MRRADDLPIPAVGGSLDGAVIILDPAAAALIDPTARLTRLTDGGVWAEGPVYLPDEDVLMYSDVRAESWRPLVRGTRRRPVARSQRPHQWQHSRPRGPRRPLRARQQAYRSNRTGRHPPRPGGPFRRQAPQLTQRCRRQVRRHHLVHRPAVRHRPSGRREARPPGAAGLPGLPLRSRERRAVDRDGRHRPPQRPGLLARRVTALRQRHQRSPRAGREPIASSSSTLVSARRLRTRASSGS